MTTIKVPKNVRDRLIAIADERGRGTTLAAVLTDLLDKHETDKTRDRLAYLEVVAAALSPERRRVLPGMIAGLG
ncbi:unnamed protein product [[Actinomadura] parvosata subsp. kistnae]|uniref:Ribbon-helix-helix protein CopG domain-containing protein n=2 Tax=Nonomuraea TaxID=83681 RepID=A0A1V0A5L6_9ACTN|nr:hypothetical protein BKM31_32215 [Nonomuraea sp. ATCC 55076]SPL96856.1 unnamed protein product [Actinomadura parvosata subsp. kistnae]